jgi:hypothetical protein
MVSQTILHSVLTTDYSGNSSGNERKYMTEMKLKINMGEVSILISLNYKVIQQYYLFIVTSRMQANLH